MKKILLLLSTIASVAVGQLTNLQSFSADFEYSAPSISGRLTGKMHYNFAAKKIFNVYDFASRPLYELWNYDTNVQTGQVRYVWCSSACDAENMGSAMPRMFSVSGDTGAGQVQVRDRNGNTRQCTKYNRPGNDAVVSISYDTNGPCEVVLSGNRIYRFSPGSKTFVSNSMSGVPPSSCPAKTCGIKLDMYQILDESGSISSSEWSQLRNFAVDVVNGFQFNQITGVGMGIVTFSAGRTSTASARVRTSFTFSQTNVRNTVTNLSQLGGNTCIGCGAMVAISDRASSSLRRSTATKAGIVVTDGANNEFSTLMNNFAIWRGNSNGNPDERNWIFFAIGIGNGINQNQLLTVAGTADRRFLTPSFSGLQALVDQIISETCILDDTTGCPNCQGLCTPAGCGASCFCPNCEDFNFCTIESCTNPALGCVYQANPCNDNNACTTDSCANGACVNTEKPMYYGDCKDIGVAEGVDNKCTSDGCRPASGCFHEYITCFDNNACTDDTCNPLTGCEFIPNAKDCTNCEQIAGQPVDCSSIQNQRKCEIIQCDPSIFVDPSIYPAPQLQCQSTGNKTCNDNNLCTLDTCNPTNGDCVFTDIVPADFCNDFDSCTRDTCTPSTGCQNIPWVCDDGDPCTFDGCNSTVYEFDPRNNAATGCWNEYNTCDDQNVCTIDLCINGTCHNTNKDCSQDPKLSILVGTCYEALCDPAISNDLLVNEGCFLQQIANTTVNRCGVCCGNELTPEEFEACISGADCSKVTSNNKSLAVGGLFLAAILIAIIALCVVAGLLGGKKGYDIYLKNKKDMQGAQVSPMYQDEGRTGVNPLYDNSEN